MLRIAHPLPRAQGTDLPTRRKRSRSPALSLSDEEARAVRACIRNVARTRTGTLSRLAELLGVPLGTLSSNRRPSAALAVAVARVSGLSVDAVLGRVPLAVLPGGAS
jgi:hypothetical protein